MHPQKRILVWIIAVGGVAVLVSYAYTFLGYPELSGGLWGDLPSSLLPFYQVCMLLAATGYFFYTYFLLFRLDPHAVRIAGRFGYPLFHVLYLLILIPSALWTPLTLVMLRAPSPWLWTIVRLTLAAVALGSLGLLTALLTLHPGEPRWAYWAAVMGSVPFCVQTVVLDALIWPAFFPLR